MELKSPKSVLLEMAWEELHASRNHSHPSRCHQHRPGHAAGALHCLSNYSCMAYIERLGCTTRGTSGESLSLSGLSFWICKVGFCGLSEKKSTES